MKYFDLKVMASCLVAVIVGTMLYSKFFSPKASA